MFGLTLGLAFIVLLSIAVGLWAKNRTVRIAVWSMGAIVVIAYALFVVLALPRMLQR